MRVMIMTDSYLPTRDGVVTSVISQRKFLEGMGHEVVIVAPDPGEEHREEGVYYFRARKFRTYEGYFVPVYYSRATKLVRELEPDVIHIRGVALMALKALIASRRTKVPTVLTYDTMVTDVIDRYSPVRLPKRMLVKLAGIYLRQELKRPGCVIVPSDSTGRELTEVLRVRPKAMETVPTPVDASYYSRADGSEVRAKYGLEDSRVLITVGRASYEKNVDVIIRSMPLMGTDVRLLVVGKGPALDDWKKAAEDAGVPDRVVFTGFVDGGDLVAHYSCADAFVSASVFETQGLTVIEAMSCGLPVACGNGRAYLDYVEDGVNGYIFDLDPESCAGAMRRALDAPQEVREAARATAEGFSIPKVAAKLVSVYEGVISGREAGR